MGDRQGRQFAGWVGRAGREAAGFARGVVGQATWPDHRVQQVQRRTLGTLVAAQALGGLAITIGIAVAALLAEQISGSEKLAGLAQTMQVLGAALASYLLAHLMGRRGRRRGLVLGYALGAVGAASCAAAGVVDSFALLLAGATLLGATTAANAQSRYAATDLARPERRARSLSLVVWATTIGAVAGPNLTGVAGDVARSLGLPALTGPFLFGFAGIVLAAAVIAVFLRPDPLLVARQAALARGGLGSDGRVGAGDGRAVGPAAGKAVGRGSDVARHRVVAVIRERPGVATGVAALALSHAVMVSVMVMTPLHMHHGGATLEVIGIVISAHVLGMFAFSPLVGWSADKWGRPPMLMAGAVVLLCALLLSGTSPAGPSWSIGAGLFLLGLGWSFCTVAASALLSESAPLSVRTDVQGAADLVMGVVAAAAGALAGVIVGTLGYPTLNVFAALLAAGVATAAEFARRTTGERGLDEDTLGI